MPSATHAGILDRYRKAETRRPATMMPLNHRSMMNVVPMPARQSENGARIMVP